MSDESTCLDDRRRRAAARLRGLRLRLLPHQPDALRDLQVAGALEKGSASYDEKDASLQFTLRDPQTGATLPIRYHGLRPANFEDAISIVAIGHWDPSSRQFSAGKLLVKCPSKYQGAEVKTYS